jgi:hypothetical protein
VALGVLADDEADPVLDCGRVAQAAGSVEKLDHRLLHHVVGGSGLVDQADGVALGHRRSQGDEVGTGGLVTARHRPQGLDQPGVRHHLQRPGLVRRRYVRFIVAAGVVPLPPVSAP